MDISRLLRDYGIAYVTEGHSHTTEGWVNVHCPFCPGSQDFHLGIHEEGTGCHCWRCGGHSTTAALSRVLRLPEREIRGILQKYRLGRRRTEDPKRIAIFPFKYPAPNSPLSRHYKGYLAHRGFDPEKLETEWNLFQSGPVSRLDGISYNYRIIIPIIWGGEVVSFQARDITGDAPLKYLACPKRREKIHHKHIVYGNQEKARRSPAIIVVEGVTDVWRLGPSSVATFGISFRTEQVLTLAQMNNRFFILFDTDPQAQEQARKLAVKLKTLGKKTEVIRIMDGEDPGSMKQKDADKFVRELLK